MKSIKVTKSKSWSADLLNELNVLIHQQLKKTTTTQRWRSLLSCRQRTEQYEADLRDSPLSHRFTSGAIRALSGRRASSSRRLLPPRSIVASILAASPQPVGSDCLVSACCFDRTWREAERGDTAQFGSGICDVGRLHNRAGLPEGVRWDGCHRLQPPCWVTTTVQRYSCHVLLTAAVNKRPP